MKKCRALQVSVLLLVISLALKAQANEEISREDLGTTRQIADVVATRFPPSEYYYVGIGRSPTGIIAFLQHLYPGSASNIPFSNAGAEDSTYQRHLHRTLMAEILTRFLPTDSQVGGRKLLVIDYSITGESLLFFAKGLKDYFYSEGRKVPISILTLGELGRPMNPREFRRWNLDLIHISLKPFSGKNITGLFDDFFEKFRRFSEYPSFPVGSGPIQSLSPRPEYQTLQRAIDDFIGHNTCADLMSRTTVRPPAPRNVVKRKRSKPN